MNLAIITGGSKGLGKALADIYLQRQWQVLECSRSGSGASHMQADLADPDASVPELAHRFEDLASRPWERVVLVNNAATLSPMGPAHQLLDAAVAHNVALNIEAGIRIMAQFAQHFHGAAGTRILVNISSGAAVKVYPGWALYCAAKAALEAFVQVMAAEQGALPHGIACINFNPGVMDTEMQDQIRAMPVARFPAVQRFIDLHAAGLTAPAEVARKLVQLTCGRVENGRCYQAHELAQ